MTESARPMLAARGLEFSYPDGTRALRGVNLEVTAGERVAIVGQNGSGKSTLIRHFVGLLRASAGEVLVGGEPVGARHVAELARTVGIAFQNPDRQIFAGRVDEEVAFGPRNLGVARGELAERVRESLDAVGLTGHGAANPYDLGFSQRKLLGLASILAMRTPVLVLDEPTTGQDARGTALVRELVRTLADQGRTLVAISHDMRFAAEGFERVVVMRDGVIILDAPPEEAFAERQWDALASTFLDPPLAARIGAAAGLGATPTEASLVAALRGPSRP